LTPIIGLLFSYTIVRSVRNIDADAVVNIGGVEGFAEERSRSMAVSPHIHFRSVQTETATQVEQRGDSTGRQLDEMQEHG